MSFFLVSFLTDVLTVSQDIGAVNADFSEFGINISSIRNGPAGERPVNTKVCESYESTCLHENSTVTFLNYSKLKEKYIINTSTLFYDKLL